MEYMVQGFLERNPDGFVDPEMDKYYEQRASSRGMMKSKAKGSAFDMELQAIQNQKEMEYRQKLDLKTFQMNETTRQQQIEISVEKRELLKIAAEVDNRTVSLQKQIEDIHRYRDMATKDVAAMKEKVKEYEPQLTTLEERCEEEKESLRKELSKQIDVIVRQVHKVKKRYDALVSDTSDALRKKEAIAKTLEEKNMDIIKKKEDTAAAAKAELKIMIDRQSEERAFYQQMKQQHDQDIMDIEQSNQRSLDVSARRFKHEFEQQSVENKKEIEKLIKDCEREKDLLEKKAVSHQTKLEETQVGIEELEEEIQGLESEHQELLNEKLHEISSLRSKLISVEKTVLSYRGIVKSEMDEIKGEVGKGRSEFHLRLRKINAEKNELEHELKDSRSKIVRMKKRLEHLTEGTESKSEALIIKEKALASLRKEHNGIHAVHLKSIGDREMQHKKEREGWKSCEEKLNGEISELRSKLLTITGFKDPTDMTKLIAHLNSEKRKLQGKLEDLEEKSKEKIGSLERRRNKYL